METIAAVHRLVAARLERHFGHAAALAASCAEHLALATATAVSAAAGTTRTATTTAGCLTGGTTIGATVRLVGKALHGEELLLAGRKRELARTINAVQKFILIHG
ncbi:MAG: hypothetical protein WBA06_03985 [Candidatus Aquilonibacter sp.]